MKPVMAHHHLLEIKNLETHFYVHGHVARAVDDISLSLDSGQTLGLVGESGCGKSVTAHSIIQLIPDPPGKIVGGKILLEGKDLLALSEAQMRNIRGNRISMIFQEPMTSLNPVFPVGDQVGEVIRLHRKLSGNVFSFLVRRLGVPGVRDTQCGFKLFSRKAARIIFDAQKLDGFSFDIEILYLARLKGFSVKEIPITWIEKEGSKVRLLSDSFKMIGDIFEIKKLHRAQK